jgi:hypothetical protein
MQALFRPSTRYRDSRNRGRLPEGWTEVELLPGLTIENFLATGVTWGDFCLFLRNKIVWMTPDVYLCNTYLPGTSDSLVLRLGVNVGNISLRVYTTLATADAAATATCDFLVRLLATCEQHDLCILGSRIAVPLSGAGLSLFFQESRDDLRKVTLQSINLSENQCLALTTMSRLDVELNINYCRLADDTAGAFVECLQSDRGPVKMSYCGIDSQVLASALTGDSRVTRLTQGSQRANDAGMAVLFAALANNRGLVELELGGCFMNDDNWTILCESLKAHPSLTILNRIGTGPSRSHTEQKAHRTQLLAEMVQRNTVLHTIHLFAHQRDEQIYAQMIRPYLEANLYRPRAFAVKKTKEIPLREKVLGPALYCVKSNPNLVWMFLSENVDAFARSEEEENTIVLKFQ